jgi:hypothetical protein
MWVMLSQEALQGGCQYLVVKMAANTEAVSAQRFRNKNIRQLLLKNILLFWELWVKYP